MTEIDMDFLDKMFALGGLHVTTTGDVAIVAPAFIASRADIDSMAEMLRDAIAEFPAAP